MVSLPKVVGVSCGILLCLGLSNAVQAGSLDAAANDVNADQSARTGVQADLRSEQARQKSGRMIEGEVLRVEDEIYFVRGLNGKEVALHTDQSTYKPANITKGDLILAEVDNKSHALSMQLAPGTDADRGNDAQRNLRGERTYDNRGYEAGRPTDSTLESGKAGAMGQ